MKILHLTPNDNINKEINALKEPATVYLAKGVYRQKIEIRADNLRIIGEDVDGTVITHGDYARKIHKDGREYNTFRTYTLCVTGDNVRLENLTVINSNTEPAEVGQCVALSVHSKRFYANNVDLRSTQDTLFLSPFPDDLVVRYRGFIPQNQLYTEGENLHLFENCKICGTVDFIFGCAQAYFKNCEIVSTYDSRNTGFTAAPAHPLAEKYGFSFVDCEFTSLGAAPSTVYLARPWRDFGKCSFVNCKLGRHFKPELFDKWNDTERDKTARFSYYALDCEFSPKPVKWAKQLTEEEASNIILNCNAKFKEIIG